jgi:hypothetical protein
LLHLLGRVAYFDNDAATATSFGQQSLAVARESGDDWLAAWALHLLGLAAYIADDFEAARRFYEDSLTIRRRLGFQEGISLTQSLLGLVAYREGAYASARTHLVEALEAQREFNAMTMTVSYIANVAALAVRLGQPERGARLSGAMRTLSENLRMRPIPIVEAIFGPALDHAREVLGDAAFAAEQQAGQRMSLDDIIVETQAIDISSPPTRGPSGPTGPTSVEAPALPNDLIPRDV